jgi:hypothetical protein
MSSPEMSSPFPGMNPYLENPDLWPEVHHLLISLLAETLNPQLLPTYRVAIEKRGETLSESRIGSFALEQPTDFELDSVCQLSGEDALLIGIPDVTVSRAKSIPETERPVAVAVPSTQPVPVMVPMPIEVQEGYLEVREVATQEVVTVIEVLSPANKRPGRGRESYLQKRERVLGSPTHLVEIDLLRQGTPMPMTRGGMDTHYRILVSRQEHRPRAELYPFSIRDPIPVFAVPLKPQSQEPVVELKSLLNKVIERSGLGVVLDYRQNPVPPLDAMDQEWVEALLRD